jgi:hypothetical protein
MFIFAICKSGEGVFHGTLGGRGIFGSKHRARSVRLCKMCTQSFSLFGIVLIPLKCSQAVLIFITRYTKETLQQTETYQVCSQPRLIKITEWQQVSSHNVSLQRRQRNKSSPDVIRYKSWHLVAPSYKQSPRAMFLNTSGMADSKRSLFSRTPPKYCVQWRTP